MYVFSNIDFPSAKSKAVRLVSAKLKTIHIKHKGNAVEPRLSGTAGTETLPNNRKHG